MSKKKNPGAKMTCGIIGDFTGLTDEQTEEIDKLYESMKKKGRDDAHEVCCDRADKMRGGEPKECGRKGCVAYLMPSTNIHDIHAFMKKTGSPFEKDKGVCKDCYDSLPHSPQQKKWLFPKIGSKEAETIIAREGDYLVPW
jgi:hypothetical protein